MHIENKIKQLGFTLPPTLTHMQALKLPFKKVRVFGTRVLISGHVGIDPDGQISSLKGRVGAEVTQDEAVQYARLVALSVLGSLAHELGDLDRITHWVKVTGFVSSANDFFNQPFVMNGFSEFILELFGEEVGAHTRSAVGVAALPFNCPVEVEAELLIS